MHDPHWFAEFAEQRADEEFRREQDRAEREKVRALIQASPKPLPVAEWLAEQAKQS